MPDELFFNSDVGVVSCIMVFTAHKPHPKNKETYFGYYKNDGFVKRKNKGRIDTYGKWDKIKEKWISYFMNKKSEDGFSINRVVSADEEWCVEAYMETDYSTLSVEEGKKAVLNFAEKNFKVIIPGYTHLQVAQCILLAHHLLAYIEALERDKQRLIDAEKRINQMPLGSGAMSGTGLPIDREYVKKQLGFKKITDSVAMEYHLKKSPQK